MAVSEIWDSLPDIDPLGDEGITIEKIVAEMVQSYEEKYEEMCRDLGITSWRTDLGEIRLIYHAATGEYTLSQA